MINNISLVGRLVREPKFYETKNKKTLVSFELAFTQGYEKETRETSTGFVKCISFYNSTKFADKYLKKGKKVSVNGTLQLRFFQDKKLNTRREYCIVCNSIELL